MAWWRTKRSLVVLVTAGIVGLPSLSGLFAADSPIPWECSTYEGDAQARCLNAFIELQQDKIRQLQEQLQAQQGTMTDLKSQVERQAAATADLQRQLSDRPSTAMAPFPYPYTYMYPPALGVYPPALGFGLYFGRPRLYGPPFPYRHFGPPRYYRPW
jgi:hypothetical protein